MAVIRREIRKAGPSFVKNPNRRDAGLLYNAGVVIEGTIIL